MTAGAGVLALFRFPLQDGDLAGCDAQLQFDSTREALAELVPGAEPCEGGCGARVGASDLSGDRLGILAVLADNALARLQLPRGMWEAPRDDRNDDGEPVVAVVFHDADRCRELRGAPWLRFAIDADCPGCGYPERSYDPSTGLFGCSSLNPSQCGFTSTERDAASKGGAR